MAPTAGSLDRPAPPLDMTDALVRERFSALLAEHRGRIHKVAITYAVSREDSEDLAQEILVQLWRSFGRYDPRRPFATWMYRVALNVAISHVRRATRRPQAVAPPGELPLDPPDPRSTAGDPDDRIPILQRLMDSLDELDRALLLLYLEERSYREIADILGLTESNVGTKLNRLRQRLRDLAKEMSR